MKFYKILLIIMVAFFSNCATHQKKTPFTIQIFNNLEYRKCNFGEIDGFLLRSGYFESMGTKNNVNTFQSFSRMKDIVTVNTHNHKKGYYLGTNNPDIYNLIISMGIYNGTRIDHNGITNLSYIYNKSEFWLHKKESSFNGTYFTTYFISSFCKDT